MSSYLPNLKIKNQGQIRKAFQILNRIRPVELALILKSILGVKREWYEIGNQRYFLDPCTAFGKNLIVSGVYEKQMVKYINNILRIGDTFIDLGGNEGYFSIIAARTVGDTGRIYCIEPQKRLWPVIIENASANNISNIVLLPYGVSNVIGQSEITLYPSLNTGASSIISSFRSILYPKQEISLTTLDAIFENYSIRSVQLMKIDIEGFEIYALKSGSNALKNKIIKNLLIEIHPEQLKRLGQSTGELLSMMREFGYRYENDGEIHFFSCN